jgi:hypothetical protein
MTSSADVQVNLDDRPPKTGPRCSKVHPRQRRRASVVALRESERVTMMKRRILFSVLAAAGLLVAAAPVGLAQPGGLPDAFGQLARAFGLEVAVDARNTPGDPEVDPAVVTADAGSSSARSGGMPASAGMSGEEFGAMVSELARLEPGAAAEYFRARTPSSGSAVPSGQGRGQGRPEGPSSLPGAATERPGAGRP